MIKISKDNRRIETERLLLRQPSMKDIFDIVEGIGNLEVSRWLLVVPHPYKRKEAIWYVDHIKKKAKKKPVTDYAYWLELKETGKVIGGIGLHKVDVFQGKAEVGYWLNAAYHGQGYGSEGLEAILKLVFTRLKLRKLEAEVFVGNPSSGKLLEKYGFKLEGTKRKACRSKATGKVHDAYIYGLLREEYKK